MHLLWESIPFSRQLPARTPFAPTGGPQLCLQLPHPPLIAASHTSHQPQPLPPSQPLKTSAATLKHHAHARYASSPIHAAGVETALTGRSPAPDPPHANLPTNQHRPVTLIRSLELEHELASFRDKGFVSQLLRQGCDTQANTPHATWHQHTCTLTSSPMLLPRNAKQAAWPVPTLTHPSPTYVAQAWELSPKRMGAGG